MHTISAQFGDVDGVEEGFRPIIDRGSFLSCPDIATKACLHHPLAFPFDVHVDSTFDVLSIVSRGFHLALLFSLCGTSYLWKTKEASFFDRLGCFHRMFPLDSFGFDGTEVWYPHPSIRDRSPLRLWGSKGEREREGNPQDDDDHGRPRLVEPSDSDDEGPRHAEEREGEDGRSDRDEAAFLDGIWHAFRISAWFGRADPRTTHSSAIHAPVPPTFPHLHRSSRLPFHHAPQIFDRSLAWDGFVSLSSFQIFPFEPGSIRICSFRRSLSCRMGSTCAQQSTSHVCFRVACEAKHDRTNRKEGEKRRAEERAASAHARGHGKVDAKTRQDTSK